MLALVGACAEPERVATSGLAAVLVTEDDQANHALRALAPDEPLVLAGEGLTHYLLEYPFDHPTLGLSPGDLPAPAAEDCGARTLGEPTRRSRLSFGPELVLEAASRELLDHVRLPALDLAACAAREGCLSLESGFAICKSTCTTKEPTPPTPPIPPAPPSFCDASGCPNLDRVCPGGLALPGVEECVELGPCGPGPFREQAPVGDRPRWVSATAPEGGDGSVDRPLRSLVEALALGATDVYLGAGQYLAPAQLTAPLRLYGVCPSQTIVLGPLNTTHDLQLIGVSVAGDPFALAIQGATLELREVALSGSSTAAFINDTQAQLLRTELQGAPQGLVISGSTVEINASSFRTAGAAPEQSMILARASTVSVEGSRFEGPSEGTGVRGERQSRVTMQRVAFYRLSSALELRGSELDLNDVYLDGRGSHRQARDRGALWLANNSRARLSRVRIEGTRGHGIDGGDSTIEVQDLTTVDTGVDLPDRFDLTALIWRRGHAQVERWRSSNDVQALDTIHPGYRVEVRDLEVSGDGDRPVVAVRSESPLLLERVRIGARRGPALTLARGGSGTVRDLAIDGASIGILFEINGDLDGERVAITADRGIFGTASGLRVSDLRLETRSAGVELGGFVGTSTNPPELEDFVFSVESGPAFTFGSPPRPPWILRSGVLRGADPGVGVRCAPTWAWRIEDLRVGP